MLTYFSELLNKLLIFLFCEGHSDYYIYACDGERVKVLRTNCSVPSAARALLGPEGLLMW